MRHTVHYVFGKTVHSISSLQGFANKTERRKTSEAIILAFTNSHFWYLVRGRVFVRVRVGNSKIANRPSPSPKTTFPPPPDLTNPFPLYPQRPLPKKGGRGEEGLTNFTTVQQQNYWPCTDPFLYFSFESFFNWWIPPLTTPESPRGEKKVWAIVLEWGENIQLLPPSVGGGGCHDIISKERKSSLTIQSP